MEKEKVKYVRGFPFPNVSWFPRESIISGIDYTSLDGDIILCSYPKTGSTWMQYIVWEILHKAQTFPPLNDILYRLIPFVEISGADVLQNMPEPRVYKNHFPYHLMNINPKAKYIYSYRNPGDIIVSLYYFLKDMEETTMEFSEFFENIMKGGGSYGDYFDHFWSFYRHSNDSHLLMVSYEKLIEDPRGQILRVAKFLGDEWHDMLIQDEAVLKKIMQLTSFDYMKANLSMFIMTPGNQKFQVENFFRKGMVGDGKNAMSKEQNERLENKIKQRMAGSEFVELWT